MFIFLCFSGTAGDSLTIQKDQLFSTKDQENDPEKTKHCAQDYKGAWWYEKCHQSNLNGVYGSTQYGEGINWYSWKGHNYSAKTTQMKIRPN